MFDTVKYIHSALGTESTAVFVLVIALGAALLFGGVALLVDRGYKKEKAVRAAQMEERAHLRPIGIELNLNTPLRIEAKIFMRNEGKKTVNPKAFIRYGFIIKPEGIFLEEEAELFPSFKIGEIRFSRHHDVMFTFDNYYHPGDSFAFPTRPKTVNPDEWEELLAGKKVLYVSIQSRFSDEVGPLYAEDCRYYRIDNLQKWYRCYGHSGILKAEQ